MKVKFFLLMALMLAVKTSHLFAQDKTDSPYFFIPNKDVETENFPLLYTDVAVNIVGVIADVKVTQLYQNMGKQSIEAIYIFPASANAAVYDMRMTIGDRIIQAKIKEKDKARRTYEAARKAGKTASLLEQHRPNVFQMSVANIMPGDTIKVELFYTELLTPEEGIYEFVYPTVVGPRYNSPEASEMIASNQKWVANPFLRKGKLSNYTFNITLSLQTGIPVKDVSCASHDVEVNYQQADEVSVRLNKGDQFRGNKDFILRYRLKGDSVESGVLLYEGEEENFFLMMMQPPERPKITEIPAREYIFVVDVSGSMNGFPLSVSKQMMEELMDKLGPKDKFNVLLFAGRAGFLAEKSLYATKENKQKALYVIDKQRGGGGTEMLPAIKKAMHFPKEPGYARSFVILTDGYVGGEAEVFDYIRTNLDQANFFAFGIGTSVNRYLIEGIAHTGFSDPFVVENAGKAEDMARQFGKYIETPILTNITVDFQGLDTYDVTPAQIPDLMGERPILVFGKYHKKAGGRLSVQGENAAGKFVKNISITNRDHQNENSALRFLWARHRLKTLADYTSLTYKDPDLKEEITDIGLKYNLLTRYTSFVAVDEKIRNTTGKNNSVKQPLSLPEGVENTAVGYTSGSVQFREEEVFVDQSIASETVLEIEPPRTAPPPPPPPPPAEPEVEEIFSVVESMPRFPGCEGQNNSKAEKRTCADRLMLEFVYKNLKLPTNTEHIGVEGTVVIQFIVGRDGLVRNPRIVRDIGYDYGQAVLEVIQLMIDQKIKWIPGKQRGRPVDVVMNLPVRIRMED